MKNEILITGATGYIGSMLIKSFIENKSATENKSIIENKGSTEKAVMNDSAVSVTAIVRDKSKAMSMLPSSVHLLEADLTDEKAMRDISGHYDYIIHCAAITKSLDMVNRPVEVIDSIVTATQNVCDLARRTQVNGMVYLSSMEIYGDVDCSDGHHVTENELGTLKLLNPRSCYPLAKRMAENICYCYYREYGVPVRIARLAQTFGKGILWDDNRAFAQFVKAAVLGEDIVLHTKGNSMGNYCAIEDVVAAILLLLEKGVSGEAYNVVNESATMRIRDVAELVAREIADSEISVVYDIPNDNRFGYAPDTGLRLSGKKLRQLGWVPQKKLVEMFADAAETVRGLVQKEN